MIVAFPFKALPNLIGLIGLSGVIINETRKYFRNLEDDVLVKVGE